MKLIKALAFTAIIATATSCSCAQKAQMTGAYGESTKLTAEEDSLFKAVVPASMGLKPRKVSRQVVAGMNYCYQCTDTNKKKVELVIYQPLPGAGEARITSIDGKEYTN